MPFTPLRLIALCIDANDPTTLARFWAAALRWDVEEVSAHETALVPSDGTAMEILFLRVPETKSGKNRLHIDITTAERNDQNETVEHLISIGARHIDIGQGADEPHVVLADPEGNEFCVIEPQNRFLSGAGRLGSITCDGTPAVGHFWTAVLGWPLVWDQDDETAIRAPGGVGPFITWGPPVAPKVAKNRLHLDVAPPHGGDQLAAVEQLIARGARRVDVGQGDVSWVVMADPDGNEFCVLTPR